MAPPELILILLLAAGAATAKANFTCSTQTTCLAIAGYVPANATTLAAVADLFTLSSNLSLAAANNLPASTPPSHPFPAGSTVRVPFPCACSRGIGVSDAVPVYTVRPGNDLDTIARVLFNGMVTFQEIAAASGISDPNVINPGQVLRIPLPCSCDQVNSLPTVHYAHMVVPMSSVEGIAAEFGTTETTLLRLNPSLNGNSSNLMANTFLDVPLRACSSRIGNNSLDRGLRVVNGSYALTANNCVQCSCDSANWELECRPSEGVSITRWDSCPSMRCGGSGDVLIGNVTSSSECVRTVCDYTGYTNSSISTQLVTETTCPSPTPAIPPNIAPPSGSTPPSNSAPTPAIPPNIAPPSGSTPPSNSAQVFGLQWWNWALLQLIILVLFSNFSC